MTIPEIESEIAALQQSLTQTQERMEQLGKLLRDVNGAEEVPYNLDFRNGEILYYVDSGGYITEDTFNDDCLNNVVIVNNRHAFKTFEYANMFRKKTQFIADLLHFKWLYDRDFEPDWDNDEHFYRVVWRIDLNKYEVATMSLTSDKASVFFSTKEMAQRCADWLNSD